MEVINTLEDMQEWMEWDVQTGKIDSSLAHTYIYNMDIAIRKLKN
jgi:hypothetical protein